MNTPDGFPRCDTAQAAVTVGTQLIVAADVVEADSGYVSEAHGQAVAQRPSAPIEAHIAGERPLHGALPTGPRGRIPKALSPADRMRRRLRITRGHAIYAQRKMTVDPVVGQIKGSGVRRVSLRGADRVTGEFQVVCAVHTLVTLWRTASAAVRRWSAAREVAYASTAARAWARTGSVRIRGPAPPAGSVWAQFALISPTRS